MSEIRNQSKSNESILTIKRLHAGLEEARLSWYPKEINIKYEAEDYFCDDFIIDIAAGTHHCLALSKSGRLYAWGSNSYGQLGLGDTKNRISPVVVEHLNHVKVTHISCGDQHSACIDTDRNLVKNLPETIKLISCGTNHVLAVDEDDNVYSWGNSDDGKLGFVESVNAYTPKKLPFFLPKNTSILQVLACKNHSVVLSNKGFVFAWGLYSCLSSMENLSKPTNIQGILLETGLNNVMVRQIFAGDAFTGIMTVENKLVLLGTLDKKFYLNLNSETLLDIKTYNSPVIYELGFRPKTITADWFHFQKQQNTAECNIIEVEWAINDIIPDKSQKKIAAISRETLERKKDGVTAKNQDYESYSVYSTINNSYIKLMYLVSYMNNNSAPNISMLQSYLKSTISYEELLNYISDFNLECKTVFEEILRLSTVYQSIDKKNKQFTLIYNALTVIDNMPPKIYDVNASQTLQSLQETYLLEQIVRMQYLQPSYLLTILDTTSSLNTIYLTCSYINSLYNFDGNKAGIYALLRYIALSEVQYYTETDLESLFMCEESAFRILLVDFLFRNSTEVKKILNPLICISNQSTTSLLKTLLDLDLGIASNDYLIWACNFEEFQSKVNMLEKSQNNKRNTPPKNDSSSAQNVELDYDNKIESESVFFVSDITLLDAISDSKKYKLSL
uniref:Uncharacterized protein LOC113788388 n=1 Tax=Dermatophagoides pteronyssinus TaxID=6956 RepID=A0A6P6XJD2_DERPT|nr:uncharacterized protein LOC113788388 [Dermatophagoides pteronyssinus]